MRSEIGSFAACSDACVYIHDGGAKSLNHAEINLSLSNTVCEVPDGPATGREETGEAEQCSHETHGRKDIEHTALVQFTTTTLRLLH